MSFTFVDLFAGIGGFHAALQPLGGECVFVSEIDKHAAKTYSDNWLHGTDIVVEGDIRELTEGERVRVPKHDVLTAGFPCQPFSKSGNQLGVNETRGNFFYNILRVIETRKPKIILLENVRNLVGPKHYNDYVVMVRLLRELGYAVSDSPVILSPHEIPHSLGGTPQHRQRIFIGGIRVGEKRANNLSNIGPLITRNSIANIHVENWDMKHVLKGYQQEQPTRKLQLRITAEQEASLIMWDDFLRLFRKNNGQNPPGLPMWTDFWNVRPKVKISKDVPDWKRQFILKNVAVYEGNQFWIDKWRLRHDLDSYIPSHRKFEWQGRESKSVFDGLIQFRPSGIRVKEPTYVPAFVAITQTPVLGWELRELSEYEAGRLQGFPKGFNFNGQRRALSMKQIGNAVHSGVASLVFRALVKRAEHLNLPWASDFISGNAYIPAIPEGLVKDLT